MTWCWDFWRWELHHCQHLLLLITFSFIFILSVTASLNALCACHLMCYHLMPLHLQTALILQKCQHTFRWPLCVVWAPAWFYCKRQKKNSAGANDTTGTGPTGKVYRHVGRIRAQYKQQQGALTIVHQRARKCPSCWAVVGTVCTFLLAQCGQPAMGQYVMTCWQIEGPVFVVDWEISRLFWFNIPCNKWTTIDYNIRPHFTQNPSFLHRRS